MDWKFIEACIVLFFRGILKLFSTKLGILIIVVFAILFYMSSQNHGTTAKVTVPVYANNAPSITQAPTEVWTESRVYYVKDFTDTGKIVTLKNYYYFDSKNWQLSKTPLPLDRTVYGELRITKRQPTP